MANPWEEIRLDDYENHMSLDSVKQLQTMNSMMKDQFEAYPVSSAMVLGVAGGNGLEHVDPGKYKTLYGVDINEDYLRAVESRYADLSGVLKCLKTDLINESDKLPHAWLQYSHGRLPEHQLPNCNQHHHIWQMPTLARRA